MKKIAINSQHGGFTLSAYAIKEYADKKGLPCYFFKHEFYKDSEGNSKSRYVPINIHDAQNEWMYSAFTVDNPNDPKYENMEWEDYAKISFDNSKIERDDSDLITVIEKLGAAANTRVSTLKIVEIPDDVQWQISEYDGMEWVSEKHRTWE